MVAAAAASNGMTGHFLQIFAFAAPLHSASIELDFSGPTVYTRRISVRGSAVLPDIRHNGTYAHL